VVESGKYSINCSWWDIDARTFVDENSEENSLQ